MGSGKGEEFTDRGPRSGGRQVGWFGWEWIATASLARPGGCRQLGAGVSFQPWGSSKPSFVSEQLGENGEFLPYAIPAETLPDLESATRF